jgi:cytochrome b-561
LIAILIYRGFRYGRKRSLKLTHAVIHGFALGFTIIGLVAVFHSHNYAKTPIPNLYSLHSWVGLAAVIIFGCQYVTGFVCFLFPMLKQQTRALFMPLHVFFGLLGFVLGVASTLMGISEKAFFAIKDYDQFPTHAALVNTLGILVTIYGSLVVYLVTEPNYKRDPLPEDTLLLTGESE